VTRTVHYPADARDFLYVNSYPRTVPAYEGVGLPFDVTESLIGKPCAEKTNEEKAPSRPSLQQKIYLAIFRLARGFCTFFVGGILVYNGGYGNRRLSRLEMSSFLSVGSCCLLLSGGVRIAWQM